MSSVFLRAFEADDYLLINKWRNDPEIQRLTGGTFRYVSSEREKEWVRDKMMNNITDIYFAICLNDETRQMIGYCSINNIDYIHRSACGGGVVIGSKGHRDGIIFLENTLLILSFVFNTLNLNRFYGNCLEEHNATICLNRSMKFRIEGLERNAIYKDGLYHNRILFSMLREEYNEHFNNGDLEISAIIKRFREEQKNRK